MTSLSGFWAGAYHYPQESFPSVNFDCELNETAGVLSGEITESHGFRHMLVAVLSGSLVGQHIDFIKSYRNTGDLRLWEIAYSGQINAEKDHIKGVWHAARRQGTFEMHRDVGQFREIEIEQETIDLPTSFP